MNLVRLQPKGGGSDIEPYIVIVTLDEDFKGQIVLLTQGSEIMRGTCPMTSPYTVQFKPMKDGVWTASSTTSDGTTISNDTDPLTVWGTYNVTLENGFNLNKWLNRGRVTKTFASLDDVLADEETVRQLMTVHDSVDYMIVSIANYDDFKTKLLASDNALKWIGLRDYTYDNMDTAFISDWLSSPKWEYALKDHVPIMTANNAPYGEASASSYYAGNAAFPWKAFNGLNDIGWQSVGDAKTSWIQYKFTNPINVRRLKTVSTESHPAYSQVLRLKIQGSNDNSIFDDLETVLYDGTGGEIKDIIFNNDKYYLIYRLQVLDTTNNNSITGFKQIQFYGRSLNVSDFNSAIPHPSISEPKMVLSGVTYWTDKTERDFEVESGVLTNSVKYIYDHGVEVVPLTKTSTSVLANIDKESKNLLRAKAGYHAENSDKLQRGSGFSTFSIGTNPNDWHLDISSLGGTLSTGFSQVTDTSDIECWME